MSSTLFKRIVDSLSVLVCWARAGHIRKLAKLSDRQLRDAGIDLALIRGRASESCPAIVSNLLSLR